MEPVNALTCWWHCACLKCVSGVRRLEKKLELFEMHTYHWPGAQIWFRHKWRKLVTASLLLHCIDWYGCLRYWNQFFQQCFRFGSKFSPIVFWRKRLQLDSKSHLTTDGLILGFFDGKWLLSSTSYLFGLKSAGNAQVVLFWRHQFFSIFSLRCILVCSLIKLVLFSHRILYYQLISFRDAMQPYFLSFWVLQPIFLGSSGATLLMTSENQKVCFPIFFVNCLLMFYHV